MTTPSHPRFRTILLTTLLALAVGTNTILAGKGQGGGKPPQDPPQQLPTYSITFLGTLGGSRSYIEGMNAQGDIVGVASAGFIGGYDWEWEHAFLNVDDGNGGRMMIDLHDLFVAEGLIPAFDYPALQGQIVQTALGINDRGQIVGEINEIDYADNHRIGYRYTPAGIDADGNPVPPQLDLIPNFQPVGINRDGVVAGTSTAASSRAAVWNADTGLDVIGNAFAVESFAIGINDIGQVLGRTSTLNTRGWRYTPGVGFLDIPVFSSRTLSNLPSAINNLGQVGGIDTDGKRHRSRVYLYSDNTGTVDLGTLGGDSSLGGDCNDRGDVVGSSQTADGSWRLFLYTTELGLFNLEAQVVNLPPSLAGQLHEFGFAINSDGLICGTTNINTEAYLLTPAE